MFRLFDYAVVKVRAARGLSPHPCSDLSPLQSAVADMSLTLMSSQSALVTSPQSRVAVDMKYHIHIHIHIHRFFVDIHGYIHIDRCLSCVNVYPVNNYKKHSCFLLSTGSIYN